MTKARIKMHGGKPMLYINETAVPPVLYGLSDIPASNSGTAQAMRNIRNFEKAGIRLVNVDSGLHLGWHKVSDYSPDAVLAEIMHVREAAPDTFVLLRLHVNPPYWWLRDNPEECVIYRTPNGDFAGTDDGESDRLIQNDASHHMRQSLASEKWLHDAIRNAWKTMHGN